MSRFGDAARSRWGKVAAIAPQGRRAHIALLAVATLLGAAVASLAWGFDPEFALGLLRENHGWLLSFVTGAPALASMLFMVIYATAVAISVPGVAILTVVGGYLFGWFHGTALVLIAATIGASGVFLLTRSAVGERVRARAAPSLERFAEGFRRNALSYGFLLNLVPIFPYALIIAVPALCGVPLLTFVVGMVLGLVPSTFLFAQLGDGLDHALAGDLPIRLISFLTPEIVLSLCGLLALGLLPVLWRRKWRWGRRCLRPGVPTGRDFRDGPEAVPEGEIAAGPHHP